VNPEVSDYIIERAFVGKSWWCSTVASVATIREERSARVGSLGNELSPVLGAVINVQDFEWASGLEPAFDSGVHSGRSYDNNR